MLDDSYALPTEDGDIDVRLWYTMCVSLCQVESDRNELMGTYIVCASWTIAATTSFEDIVSTLVSMSSMLGENTGGISLLLIQPSETNKKSIIRPLDRKQHEGSRNLHGFNAKNIDWPA